jgi:hypothetical protein
LRCHAFAERCGQCTRGKRQAGQGKGQPPISACFQHEPESPSRVPRRTLRAAKSATAPDSPAILCRRHAARGALRAKRMQLLKAAPDGAINTAERLMNTHNRSRCPWPIQAEGGPAVQTLSPSQCTDDAPRSRTSCISAFTASAPAHRRTARSTTSCPSSRRARVASGTGRLTHNSARSLPGLNPCTKARRLTVGYAPRHSSGCSA